MNFRRLSFLTTMTLCALAFIFSAVNASAAEGVVIGTLKFARGCTVLVNGKKQANGYQVHAGDVINTSPTCKARVELTDGGTLAINTNTRVRVYLEGRTVVAAVLVGGVNYIPAVTPGGNEVPVVVETPGSGAEPLPYLAAFGSANFPAGGGSSSGSGNIVSVVLPNGRIAYYDSFGNFIRYN